MLSPEEYQQLYFWGGVIVIVLALSSVVFAAIRKRSLAGEADAAGPVFSLADIRKLRDEGQLSEEEYERLRARIIGEARAAGSARPSQAPPGPAPQARPPTNASDDPGGSTGVRE